MVFAITDIWKAFIDIDAIHDSGQSPDSQETISDNSLLPEMDQNL